MGRRAHEDSRRTTWTRVGTEYAALFDRVAAEPAPPPPDHPYAIVTS